ncbi:MAG: tRNA lysidine(34) synthetase TilS [Candidatus Eisenbacteria bacterium]
MRLRRLEPLLRRALRGPCHVRHGARVLVAVSGGADSTALLVALASLAREFGLALHAAHLHHGLRGAAADADRAHVAALCERLGLPLTTGRLRPAPRTGEAALRSARRRFLLATARRRDCEAIATAHTADDQLETLLMRLARGTGLAGLGGMRARHGAWLKPCSRPAAPTSSTTCGAPGSTGARTPATAAATTSATACGSTWCRRWPAPRRPAPAARPRPRRWPPRAALVRHAVESAHEAAEAAASLRAPGAAAAGARRHARAAGAARPGAAGGGARPRGAAHRPAAVVGAGLPGFDRAHAGGAPGAARAPGAAPDGRRTGARTGAHGPDPAGRARTRCTPVRDRQRSGRIEGCTGEQAPPGL